MTKNSNLHSFLAFLVVLIVTLASSPLSAETGGALGDWKIDTFRWTGTTDAVKLVEVHNPHGNLRFRKAEYSQAFASAAIQRHKDDPRLGDIRVVEQDGKVTIDVVFDTPEDFDPAVLTDEMAKRRIDLTVLIPAGAHLNARTEDGEIEAKGLDGDVSATSTAGDIVLSIRGSLEARTDRGAVKAVLKSADWRKSPVIETTTGEIVVWLHADADTTIQAQTAGWITTDYSIDITSPSTATTKTAVAKIGHGKHPFPIHSTKGNIRLSRLQSLPAE